MIKWGIPILVIGAVVWFFTNTAANDCANVWVQAVEGNRCTPYIAWHEFGMIAGITGILLIIVGAILKGRQ